MNKILSIIMIVFIAIMIYLSILFFKQNDINNNITSITTDKSKISTTKKNIHINFTNSKKVIKKRPKQKILKQKRYNHHYSINDEYGDYSLTFLSSSHIEKKDANIPLHLNIGDKKVSLSMPLVKIDDINNSKLIIKDRNNKTVAQILPYFINDIGTNDEVTMDIDPSTHNLKAIHINKVYKNNEQYIDTGGNLPDFGQ